MTRRREGDLGSREEADQVAEADVAPVAAVESHDEPDGEFDGEEWGQEWEVINGHPMAAIGHGEGKIESESECEPKGEGEEGHLRKEDRGGEDERSCAGEIGEEGPWHE